MAMQLSQLFTQAIHGADVALTDVSLDSRTVKEGDLFLAFAGEAQDGHQYIAQAVANGAKAVVLEDAARIGEFPVSYVQASSLRWQAGHIASRFYGEPSKALRVIGVTGTNGKTSITHYVEQLIAACGNECAVIGTLGIRFDQQLVATQNTTPDAVTLQKIFRDIQLKKLPFVAMEVSSHALVQGRCNGIQFEGAVFSNLSHDHLDYHKTLDDYFVAKAALFSAEGLRWAVLNKDDARYAELRRYIASHVAVLSYSLSDSSADVYLRDVVYEAGLYRAQLSVLGQNYSVSSVLQGAFNLSNLLAAVAVLQSLGADMQKVAASLVHVQPVAGRMQTVVNEKGINALVDYAHTPDALANVLNNLKPLTRGKLIVVFGCGGDRDRTKRAVMARVAEQCADFVVLTDDNPRFENPAEIRREIIAGFAQENYQVIPDRAEAIAYAVEQAKAGDTVLVAGKGHELYQIVGAEKCPFDDAAQLRNALMSEVH